MSGPLGEVEAAARRRFHRFSARAWQQWLDRGARPLAEALARAPGWTDAEREALLAAAAGLGAEAVGLGYLHVSAPGTRDSWTWHALGPLLAERIPRRPPREALEELATLWNLAEALERGAPWIRHLVLHFAPRLKAELPLASFIRSVDEALGEGGLVPLGDNPGLWRHAWIPVEPPPSDALPGQVAFLAPRVVEVGLRGTGQATFVLLRPEPLVLGHGPWVGPPGGKGHAHRPASPAAWLSERRTGPLLCEAATEHAWVAVPRLSQRALFTWRTP